MNKKNDSNTIKTGLAITIVNGLVTLWREGSLKGVVQPMGKILYVMKVVLKHEQAVYGSNDAGPWRATVLDEGGVIWLLDTYRSANNPNVLFGLEML